MAAGPDVTEGRTIGVLRKQLEAALAERDEARAQQAALAEVLQLINGSPGVPAIAFDAMVGKAMVLCEAAFGALLAVEGAFVRLLADRNTPPDFTAFWKTPRRTSHVSRELQVVHIADVRTTEAYRQQLPVSVASVEAGIRTILLVPLVSEGRLIGLFALYRQEVRPFTDRQIALVESFAAQAVIAMENARLLTEQREALEQQTATAEILSVINSSPGDLAPVFDAILEKARQLCDAAYGDLWTYDGELLHLAATQGEPGFAAWLRAQGPVPVWPGSPTEVLQQGADHVQYEDPIRDGHYEAVPEFLAQVERAGIRSTLFVPLWKDHALLGVCIVYRREVRRFATKQVAALQGFAAQAVVAMDNARLINETREALEQQTATTEVLEVINSSPGNLVPVFDAMLEKAMHLCEAAFGVFLSYDSKLVHPLAFRGLDPGLRTRRASRSSPLPGRWRDRLCAPGCR